MRKIDYIFIDSDREALGSKSDRYDVSNLRYHYVVNRPSSERNPSSLGDCRVAREVGKANSQGCVINPTPVQLKSKLIDGPIYDPDKYNKCSIFVRYCGNLNSNDIFGRRAALLNLLVELRQHFPDAKILGLSEIDGKELHSRNIIVSDAMNVLRRELSDLP